MKKRFSRAKLSAINLHHHILVIDAELENTLDQSKMRIITVNLVKDLLANLKMYKLGKLEIYPATDLRAPGWSFIQPITTSHIAGHYFENPSSAPNIHIDIYSCKFFSWRKVISIANRHLKLANWHANVILRKLEAKKRKIIALNGKSGRVDMVVRI